MKNVLLNLTKLSLIISIFLVFQPSSSNAQACTCKEYIYLNEPNASATLKFEVTNNILLTEIPGDNGFPWYPGSTASQLPSPHGLAMDLNGNMYIAETGGNSTIRRLDCKGNIAPTTDFALFDGGNHVNMFAKDNFLVTSGEGFPTLWDLCTGENLGSGCLNRRDESIGSWGMSYNETTDMVYVTTGFPAPTPKIYAFTYTEFLASISGTCIDPLVVSDGTTTLAAIAPGNTVVPSDITFNGIVGDNSGNIYAVVNSSPPQVLKYDANGVFLGLVDNNSTLFNPHGIVWSPTQDRIWVASFSDDPIIDCIAVFDAQTMTYLGTAAPNPNTSVDNTAKTLDINVECCPDPAAQQIDETICVTGGEETIFLSNIFPCDEGIVCEGTWAADDAAAEAVFNECDESVTAITGCFGFSKTSGAASPGSQCGEFNVTMEVCFAPAPTAPAISVTDNTCNPDVAGSINVDTPCVDGSTLEWSTDA